MNSIYILLNVCTYTEEVADNIRFSYAKYTVM